MTTRVNFRHSVNMHCLVQFSAITALQIHFAILALDKFVLDIRFYIRQSIALSSFTHAYTSIVSSSIRAARRVSISLPRST